MYHGCTSRANQAVIIVSPATEESEGVVDIGPNRES